MRANDYTERKHCVVTVMVGLVVLLGPPVVVCTADPIAHEGFAYRAGTLLVDLDGGTGWAGSWIEDSGNHRVLARTLNYTDGAGVSLPVFGNALALTRSNRTNSRWPASPLGAAGTSLWFSFISKTDCTGGMKVYDSRKTASTGRSSISGRVPATFSGLWGYEGGTA